MLVRYYDELLGFFVRTVRDPHEAQDLVQETFERVLAKIQAGEQVDQARSLLFEVARNLLVDRHRRARVRDHETDDILLEMSGPPSGEPEAVYAGRQRVRLLISTIEQLPPRCRTAFVLHKIEGMPQAAVAAAMGVGVNTVERHIMLAVAAWRKALGGAARRRDAPQPSEPAGSAAPGD